VLDSPARVALVIGMMHTVLDALAESQCLDDIVVVSPDQVVLHLARLRGAVALMQRGSGLNPALEQARASLVPGSSLLAIPADLPLVQPFDIRSFVGVMANTDVVLAPDRYDHGTNALGLAPRTPFAFAFGPGSFARHAQAATDGGLLVSVLRSAGLAQDVDLPDDLKTIAAHGWSTADQHRSDAVVAGRSA
jgi:2-phospho-L-lactate guanylyltransferase